MICAENKLERFFARWEFTAKHMLCASDVEPLSVRELLDLADEDSAARWSALTLGYTETAGHPELRAAIADQYTTISPEEVLVCGGGAAEAVFLVSNVLLTPGTHAVAVAPAFEPLHKVAAGAGAELTQVPLNPAAGWTLDPADIRQALTPRTRMIAINFPHNPTGVLLEPDRFRELAHLAGERGITLVSDEVYRFMEFEPSRRLPAAADVDDRAVSIGVMSKAYGMPGVRIGWIATRDRDLLRRLSVLKDYTTVCASAPSEILALMALRNRERVVARCRGIVLDNLPLVDAFFTTWSGLFDWVRPGGGTVGFPRLRAAMPVDRFVTELAEEEGVLLLPGGFFDAPDRFRIGLGRYGLAAALDRLDAFVRRRLA